MALVKIHPRLRIASLEDLIDQASPPQGGRSLHERNGECVEHFVGERKVFVGLPANAAFGKHVVIPRNAQAVETVALVRDARIFERVEVQINDVVERAHRRAHHVTHRLLAFHRKTSERKARKVAYDEIARTRGGHHHGISVLGLCFHRHAFNRCHILRDFGAQVAAIDNALHEDSGSPC